MSLLFYPTPFSPAVIHRPACFLIDKRQRGVNATTCYAAEVCQASNTCSLSDAYFITAPLSLPPRSRDTCVCAGVFSFFSFCLASFLPLFLSSPTFSTCLPPISNAAPRVYLDLTRCRQARNLVALDVLSLSHSFVRFCFFSSSSSSRLRANTGCFFYHHSEAYRAASNSHILRVAAHKAFHL